MENRCLPRLSVSFKKEHMADVLIVSDFEFPLPNPSTMEKIDKEKTLGARFYGLKIGHYGVKDYKLIMDKIWEV
mgnify:CR=1 FL=1